ncbi:MAG: AI-2E family transporter [Gammaproteobacteria bacterium]
MFNFLNTWYRRYFTDPQASLLTVLIVVSFITIYFMGEMLAPLLASIVFAYLLEGPVSKCEQRRAPRILAVNIVFMLFAAFMVFLVLILLPVLSRQASQFFQEVPRMINKGQGLLMRLPEQYPEIISEDAIREIIRGLSGDMSAIGQNVLSVSFASIPIIVTYLVLVPLMIFFFLKDKTGILEWLSRFLPTDRALVTHLWHEMDAQIGNYIRGKVYEIIIVGSAAYVIFTVMGLNYASLLALIVGLSVLIPYIGAATVTLPVAVVGYFQWGLQADFAWLMVWYLVLQFLDGNVLVPVLFSDVVNLHPVAIIAAILVFGGLWGFWGVFFAIPLATLVKALINIWPTTHDVVEESQQDST